jgi:outer membrane protein TolC
LELQGRKTGWQESDTRFGARIQLNIPLFDFGRLRAEERSARARTDAAQKSLDDANRVAEAELNASQIELAAALKQIEHYEAILTSAKKLVEISTVGFRERAVTLIELLEGTRSLREVEDGYVEARLRLSKAQAAYLQASGRLLGVIR